MEYASGAQQGKPQCLGEAGGGNKEPNLVVGPCSNYVCAGHRVIDSRGEATGNTWNLEPTAEAASRLSLGAVQAGGGHQRGKDVNLQYASEGKCG